MMMIVRFPTTFYHAHHECMALPNCLLCVVSMTVCIPFVMTVPFLPVLVPTLKVAPASTVHAYSNTGVAALQVVGPEILMCYDLISTMSQKDLVVDTTHAWK